MKLLVILLIMVALTGCESPVDVAATDKRALNDDELSRALHLYRQTAECVSLPNESQRVRWWIVESVTWSGEDVGGVQDRDDIYIERREKESHILWRHESMHHILWRATGASDSRHDNPHWSGCVDSWS